MQMPDPVNLALLHAENPTDYEVAIEQSPSSVQYLYQIFLTTQNQLNEQFWQQISQLPSEDRTKFAGNMLEEDAFHDLLAEEAENAVAMVALASFNESTPARTSPPIASA